MDTPGDAAAGLWVEAVPAGVAVSWCPSDDFTALAGRVREPGDESRPGGQEDGLRDAVHATVVGLLLSAGHTVTEHSGHITVSATGPPRTPRPASS